MIIKLLSKILREQITPINFGLIGGDVQSGFITAKNSSEKTRKQPLIFIMAVSIHNRDKQFLSTNKISLDLARLKSKTK